MKKIVIFILVLLLLPFNIVYAETVYSEWSTTPTGYPRETEAIQYGVILPKVWSEWSYEQADNETDLFFQKVHDFGTEKHPEKDKTWFDAGAKTVYEVTFDEVKHITKINVDVDCYYDDGNNHQTNYIQPKIYIYLDGKKIDEKDSTSDVQSNFSRKYDVYGKKVEIKISAGGGNRNVTVRYNNWTYVRTEKLMYSHVIEWEEPTNWRFDTPYELLGGENSQKPAERTVYRYPLNPEITVKKIYLYEDDTFEDIKNLAKATDYTGEDITEDIIVTKIKYDDDGTEDYNPDSFDPYKSDTIHVTYYVINELGIEDTKTVKLYILRDGLLVDFNLYSRYISKDYIYTLQENSIWKNDDYKNKLEDAFEWIGRK